MAVIKVAKGCLGEEELCQVKEAFDYGYFGHAYKVIEFESALKEYLNAPHVVAVNTGTSALHLSLDALGMGPGDEVITPSMTFVATFQAISATGATPVACEVEPDTLLIDIQDVKKRITSRTKAIIPVHYAGGVANMDELLKLKELHGIRIVEDAAHAIGSVYPGKAIDSPYRGKLVGSFGDVICFSFDSIKTITCGEGGAVVCNEPELADLMRQKRLLGMDRKTHTNEWKQRAWSYEVRTQGFRYHMSNINAAIGLAQLKKLEGFIMRRREICQKYDQAFSNIVWLRPLQIDYNSVAPFMYVVRVKGNQRDALVDFLKQRDIETGISYIPNHIQPFYNTDQEMTVTSQAYEEILSLPLHCGLTDEDVYYVIESVSSFNPR